MFALLGPTREPELLELEHQQADGLGDKGYSPNQQGGDGAQASGWGSY